MKTRVKGGTLKMSGEIETNDECFFDGLLSHFMDKNLVKRIRDKESPSFFPIKYWKDSLLGKNLESLIVIGISSSYVSFVASAGDYKPKAKYYYFFKFCFVAISKKEETAWPLLFSN